jgi:hypothetical protein
VSANRNNNGYNSRIRRQRYIYDVKDRNMKDIIRKTDTLKIGSNKMKKSRRGATPCQLA